MKNWKTILAAVLLNVVFIYLGSEMMLSADLDILSTLQNSYILGLTPFVTPIFVCLPYVTEFYEEKRKGYYRFKVMRYGKLRYVMSHVGKAMLSGMAVMLLSFAVFEVFVWTYGIVRGEPMHFEGGTNFYGTEYTPTVYYNLVMQGHGWIVHLINILFVTCYGMIWPCFGIVASVFVSNRRLAVIFPFLLKRLLEFLPDKLSIFCPNRLLFNEDLARAPLGGTLYVAAYLMTVFLIAVLGTYIGLKRLLERQG
jgi:hypothetical protein